LAKQLNYFNTLVTEFCAVVSDEEHPYVPTKDDQEYFKNFRVEYDTIPNPNAPNHANNSNNNNFSNSSGGSSNNNSNSNNSSITNSKISNALPVVLNSSGRRTSDARDVVVEEYIAYGDDPNQKKDKKKDRK
jgi:hypothetical protein